MSIPPIRRHPKSVSQPKMKSVSKTVKAATEQLGSQKLYQEREIDFAAKEIPEKGSKFSSEVSKISRVIRGK